jgi:hypothetical protein
LDSSLAWSSDAPQLISGKATLVRALYEGSDMTPTWEGLLARASANLRDAAAFFDLSIIAHAVGRREEADVSQKAALDISKRYRIVNGLGTGPNVLVFATAGDFMANTPIEFLLEHSNANILLHYVDAQTEHLGDVPPHDVAFVGIAESAANIPVLENLDRLLADWTGPIMNRAARHIIRLSRDAVAATFKDEPSILAPATIRLSRDRLQSIASGEAALSEIADIGAFPIIVRPAGTHAGEGMERITATTDLSTYLASQPGAEFFIAPFIDYSGKDGKFRKQRIAFINGKAYASHLAVSEHWMVHYLSAGMAEHEDRRAEEASWMATFDEGFAARHALAFDLLHRHIALDYFAIDCAELPDGRLLLFEADVAMIVHSMDSESLFPYKKTPMRKLFAAFENALLQRINRKTVSSSSQRCAHTGKPVVYQRTDNDCLICALAMFLGRSYEEIEAIAYECNSSFPSGGPMSHSIMRTAASRCGHVLLSSIYMLWSRPAIIGIVSPTIADAGHAVFWDGEKIIDPGFCDRVDRGYIDRWGLEFTQRANDLEPLIVHENYISASAGAVMIGEPL